MDRDGNFHECDYCDFTEEWHKCMSCGVEHRPPTADELARQAEREREEFGESEEA